MSPEVLIPFELAQELSDDVHKRFPARELTDLLRKPRRWECTATVKTVIGDCGRRLGYEALARDLGHGQEFLYDVVWYNTDDASGLITDLIMVCEYELRTRKEDIECGIVDNDFYKLLQARCDLRVWFSSSPSVHHSDTHKDNCKRAIKNFRKSMIGDTYLFIMHNWLEQNLKSEVYIFDGK